MTVWVVLLVNALVLKAYSWRFDKSSGVRIGAVARHRILNRVRAEIGEVRRKSVLEN